MTFAAVILGAGLGKRMQSDTPKVLHEVSGKPMIRHTIEAVKALTPERIVIVVGNRADEVRKRIMNDSVTYVTQHRLLGTGDALLQAKKALTGFKGTIIVLNGDSPLIQTGTIKDLLEAHRQNNNGLSLLSFTDDSLSGYGRIRRNRQGKVTGIVEDRHATARERSECRELNSGVYALEARMLDYLGMIRKNVSSGEYYLTDIVGIASRKGEKIGVYPCPSEEVRGVNTRSDLQKVSEIMNGRTILQCLSRGVSFLNPATTIVHSSVLIGKDTVVYPNTCIEGNTTIGKDCTICPGVRIVDSTIGNNVLVKDCSLIENRKVRDSSVIGPHAYLRPVLVKKRRGGTLNGKRK